MLINMRNGLMAGKRLPYDAEVEYLESTGTQWIDTGVVPSSRTRMICYISRVSRAGSLGWGSSGFAESFFLGWSNANYYASVSRNTTQIDVPDVAIDANDHVFDLKSGDMKFDGITFGTSTIGDTAVSGQTLYLFARHVEWNATPVTPMVAKIHRCQIYDGVTLIRDFQPVRFTNEQGVSVGEMYDRVTGTFMERHGTFVIGPDKASGASAANGGGHKLRCPRRSYRRSSRPSARFWQPRLWKEVA